MREFIIQLVLVQLAQVPEDLGKVSNGYTSARLGFVQVEACGAPVFFRGAAAQHADQERVSKRPVQPQIQVHVLFDRLEMRKRQPKRFRICARRANVYKESPAGKNVRMVVAELDKCACVSYEFVDVHHIE